MKFYKFIRHQKLELVNKSYTFLYGHQNCSWQNIREDMPAKSGSWLLWKDTHTTHSSPKGCVCATCTASTQVLIPRSDYINLNYWTLPKNLIKQAGVESYVQKKYESSPIRLEQKHSQKEVVISCSQRLLSQKELDEQSSFGKQCGKCRQGYGL